MLTGMVAPDPQQWRRSRPARAAGRRSPLSATLRAWAPATRGMPLPTLNAVLVLAAIPAVSTAPQGGRDLTGALVAASVISSTTVAFAVEDPAGETLSGSPTSLARRRGLRLSAIVLAVAVVWLALVALAGSREPTSANNLAQRAAEVAAVSGLAAAAAGLLHSHDVAGAGPIGATAGALTSLLISSLAYRFHDLPALMSATHHGRWWVIGLAGWAIAAWTWRDPARR